MATKKLYLAKCMKDLESETELKQNQKSKPTKFLVSSADKLFKQAQEKYIDKDEELAYVQYMRFLELVILLQKRSDFINFENKKKQLLEQANIAIAKAENLKESLNKRYSTLEKVNGENDGKNNCVAARNGQNYGKFSDLPPENLKDKEKLFISSSELFSLLTSDKSSIIIMDIRSAKDFASSCIKHSACINIPEETLKPGLTAVKLESALPKESLSQWFKRGDADQIILVDWETENETTQNVCLNYLKIAMSQNHVLKKPPLILKGGFKSWMRKYPMLTTSVLSLDQLNNSKTSVTSDTSEKEKLSISSSELYSLIMGKQSVIIIMDTRPATDFTDSHIKHSGCISVPQEILKPGITAAKLEGFLPKESLSLWYKRKEADFIILVDWDSEEVTQNIYLNALTTAMIKWDTCVLKKTPLLLKGGYKDWMRKYPMCTTQALSFDLMTNLKMSPIVTDLSGIEYPNLDENVNDEVQIRNQKNSSDMLFKKSQPPDFIINDISPTTTFSNANRKSTSAPLFDRKSKPIDAVSKVSNTEIRTNKSVSHSPNSMTENSLPDKKLPPSVDRKSKSAVLKSVSDKPDISSNAKDPVLVSFNKEQSLEKENIEIVNQKLLKEQEFEKLCLRKELEAEESKRIEIQKQEEMLLEKIKQLQIQKEDKETELLEIKKENLKIKKLLDEKIDKEYKMKKEQELKDDYEKQTALAEIVEKMREERKRKEAENQKKKETHLAPPREIVSANPTLRRADTNPAPSSTNSTEYTMPLSGQTSVDGSGRGLVRSHSSPNIAQMMNEEECASQKIPSIDRSLKPRVNVNSQLSELNRARQRNLNPLYGNCPVRPATGLRNLGNTCFMNSVIQCLSNTIPLANFINSGQYVEHINRENRLGTGGELIEEFAAVIKALWMGQYKSFYPRDFKNTVSKCLAVCIGNEQQDSHEFLVVLMEKLHADLNKKYMKNAPKLDPNCNESLFWQHHKTYNGSKISDIFDGLLKSTLTCLSCRKTSDSFEVFSCLSLPIMTSKCTLKECFQHFLRAEKISGEAAWDCPRCKQKKEAEKRLQICRTPEVLIIQLKRFSYEGLWRRKLQTHVDFDFSMEVPYEQNSRECYRMYSLYGIVNHYGTLEGGHYTAYCKTNTSKWFKYDDHEVSEISSSDIKTSAAYLLFYISSDLQSRL